MAKRGQRREGTVQDEYPHKDRGAGQFWQPHRLGGTAPTVEESRRMDAEDFEKR